MTYPLSFRAHAYDNPPLRASLWYTPFPELSWFYSISILEISTLNLTLRAQQGWEIVIRTFKAQQMSIDALYS